MGGGKIADVDVIPYRCTVGGIVISTEDLDRGCPALGRSYDEREEMRLRCVLLADLAVGVGAGSIEIAQSDVAQSISAVVPAQHVLHEQLGHAIRIYRVLRMILSDRQRLRNSVG